MSFRQELFGLPNLISATRILIAPLLFAFAIQQMEAWFLGALIFSGLTDVIDGFLARRLKLTSALGAHLDSWGDFIIYLTMAACAWILWPELTTEVLFHYTLILFSILLPAGIGLVKFGRLTGYHTWSVKLAVLVTFAGYILLYAGIAAWPFVLASWLCVIAGAEEILITLVLRRERTDVRSLWAAWQHRGR
ncbi:MAG: CDP-alcohol phosphatidyltransferase family protein [Gammaproteobacteria bacterium]|jgi:CDP-diacylglycerol--glycerol-3-phosphate 3-phosphatidyltransferase|nr:CDP-alcohol phosphatidyltransferase family protein [Gammaproteobacteria bacterium]